MDNYYGYETYETITPTPPPTAEALVALEMILIMTIIFMIIMIITLISNYKIYKKAGKKGWEALIPIYNYIVLFDIVKIPAWQIIFFFIPIAQIYILFKMNIELAHKFNKSTGFGVLAVFFPFICLPILAFSKNATYNDENNLNNVEFNNESTPSINSVSPDMNNYQSNSVISGNEQLNQTQVMNNYQYSQTPNLGNENLVQPNQAIYGTAQTTDINSNGLNQNIGVNNNQPLVQTLPNQNVNNIEELNSTLENISANSQNVQVNKFCSNCGNALNPNQTTCPNCGTQIL